MIEPLLEAERLMAVGLLDQAELRFTQIAEADPRNSIAVVGLARVAVERGDDEAALQHARRAAAIDPDNPVAARLIARLEEVAATRAATAQPSGPPVEPPTGPSPAQSPPQAPPSARPPAPPPSRPAPRTRRRGLLGRILGRD
jgi:tetratricopeptide (TPR) repeat protein